MSSANANHIMEMLSGRVEEKIAGLVLTWKLLDDNENFTKSADKYRFILDVVENVEPIFIKKMWVKNSLDKSRIIQNTAFQILRIVSQFSDIVKLFDNFTDSLIEVAWSLQLEAEESKENDCNKHELLLKQFRIVINFLMALQSISRKNILELTLKYTNSIKFPYISTILQIIAQFAKITKFKTLSPESAKIVRVMIIQSLHSYASESSRDIALLAISDIFHFLSPCWTIETIDSIEVSNKLGIFAESFTSLIHAEIHLYLVEILEYINIIPSIKNSTPNIQLQDQLQEGEESHNKSKIITESQQWERIEHARRMILIVLELFDKCLYFLIGNNYHQRNDNDNIEVEVEGEGTIWSSLPSTVLLNIRQSCYSVLHELFDFMNNISKYKQHIQELQLVVQSIASSVGKWAVEDEDLIEPLCRVLSSFLCYSSIPLEISMDSEQRNILWNSFIGGNDNDSDNNKSNTNDDECHHQPPPPVVDVLFTLLPCILSVLQSEDETDDTTSKIYLQLEVAVGLVPRLLVLVYLALERRRSFYDESLHVMPNHLLFGSCCGAADLIVVYMKNNNTNTANNNRNHDTTSTMNEKTRKEYNSASEVEVVVEGVVKNEIYLMNSSIGKLSLLFSQNDVMSLLETVYSTSDIEYSELQIIHKEMFIRFVENAIDIIS
eukprot:gene7002-14245_t